MPVPTRQPVKEALLIGVTYTTNDNLKDNNLLPQPGAHKDILNLRKLLTSMECSLYDVGEEHADESRVCRSIWV